MPGIGAQIHQHLLQLSGVGFHPQRLVGQRGVQVRRGRQGGPQQGSRLVDHRPQPLHHQRVQLAPAEGQDLLHQTARAQAGLLDLLQADPGAVLRRQVNLRQGHIAQDGRQDVVEIVGDAAGQGADGFHLLRLTQLPLQRAQVLLGLTGFGHVLHGTLQGDDAPARVARGLARHLQVADGAAAQGQLEFVAEGLPVLQGLQQAAAPAGARRRRQEAEYAFARQRLVAVQLQHRADVGRETELLAGRVQAPVAQPGQPAGHAQPRFGIAQCFFAGHARADVQVRAHHAHGPALAVVLHHAATVQHPHPVAVAVAHPVLRLVTGAAARHVVGLQGLHAGQVLRVHQCFPAHMVGGHFTGLAAHHLVPARVHRALAAGQVGVPQRQIAPPQGQRQALGFRRGKRLAFGRQAGHGTALALPRHGGQAGGQRKSRIERSHQLGLPQPVGLDSVHLPAHSHHQRGVHRQVDRVQRALRDHAAVTGGHRTADHFGGRLPTGQVPAERRPGPRHVQAFDANLGRNQDQHRAIGMDHATSHVLGIDHRTQQGLEIVGVERRRQRAVEAALRVQPHHRQVQRVHVGPGLEGHGNEEQRRVGPPAQGGEIGLSRVVAALGLAAVAGSHAAAGIQPLHGLQAGQGFSQGFQLRPRQGDTLGLGPVVQVIACALQGGIHAFQLARQVLLHNAHLHRQPRPLLRFSVASAVEPAPSQGCGQQRQSQH